MANNDLIRERLSRQFPIEDRESRRPAGAQVMIGRVATADGSIAVGKFLNVYPETILGDEVESGAGTFQDSSVLVPVLLLGPAVAKNGDRLACYRVDYRWVASRMATSSGTGPVFPLPGCPCLHVPGTLTMRVARPFPPWMNGNYPATIQYGAIPADMIPAGVTPGSLPAGWWSTSAFLSRDGARKFRYFFRCYQGIYQVGSATTIDSPSHVGMNAVFVNEWLIGTPGNTCSPFSLTRGYWEIMYGPGWSEGITISG